MAVQNKSHPKTCSVIYFRLIKKWNSWINKTLTMWRSFRTSTNLVKEQQNLINSATFGLFSAASTRALMKALTLSLSSWSPGRCAPPSSSSSHLLAERGREKNQNKALTLWQCQQQLTSPKRDHSQARCKSPWWPNPFSLCKTIRIEFTALRATALIFPFSRMVCAVEW